MIKSEGPLGQIHPPPKCIVILDLEFQLSSNQQRDFYWNKRFWGAGDGLVMRILVKLETFCGPSF